MGNTLTKTTSKVKNKNKKLDSYALKAFETLKNPDYDKRIEHLEECKEYGYALLNIWNRIEQTLKLLKYYDNINNEFPKFLENKRFNKKWKILKTIDETLLEHILKTSKTYKANILQDIRNNIVHYNKTIDNETYQEYKNYATQFLKLLKLPSQEDFQKKKNNTRSKKQKQAK
ncbi:MAG: hypothetical protein K2O69_03160 [Odoribacter sp.]|nr:hypothetical protein [Odoribacter sp.]